LAGSSTLAAAGVTGAPNVKLDFGASTAGVVGLDPKSKVGFAASEAGAVGADVV
jgi:hypothetical protein